MPNQIDPETRLRLLTGMLRIRRIEEAVASRYAEQEMRCPVHLSVGQEATAVGVSARLSGTDLVLSAHRSHAHYLAKGGDLAAMLGELYGKETGCAKGRGGSMHLFDLEAGVIAAVPIVGSSLPIGVGVAWGIRTKGLEDVVVIYLGDGATEEGAFAESLDFASLKGLPVLFVCENNQYSVYTSLHERQSARRSICQVAEAHGVTALQGDGNNVEEVFSLAGRAIEHIMTHKEPFLLELSTYRWLEHCGSISDDHLGYRPDGELAGWLERCPIAMQRDSLLQASLLTEEKLAAMEIEICREIEAGFRSAKAGDFPAASELFKHVYAEDK